MSTDDALKLLGLARDASPQDVRKAYTRVIQQYHPDKVQHLGVEFQRIAEQKTKELNEAYQLLKDYRPAGSAPPPPPRQQRPPSPPPEYRKEEPFKRERGSPPPPPPPPKQGQPPKQAPQYFGLALVAFLTLILLVFLANQHGSSDHPQERSEQTERQASQDLTLLKRAESGDPKAQRELADHYYEDMKIPSAAASWYRQAANQGDSQAQVALGYMLLDGVGVPTDRSEGVKWLQRAAQSGHSQAQVDLGWMYYRGDSVEKDASKAAQWFRNAAGQRNADAQLSLAMLYHSGDGVPRNDVVALMYYILAVSHTQIDADISRWHTELLKELTSSQIAEAGRLAREWVPTDVFNAY